MTGLVDELKLFADKGIAAAELTEHKKAYQAKFDNDLGNDEVVSSLLEQGLYTGRTLAFLGDVNRKVQALSAADVVGALKKFVRPEALIKVKAGDLAN